MSKGNSSLGTAIGTVAGGPLGGLIGGVLGSLIGGSSADSASEEQVEATNRAIDLQRDMYNKNVSLQEPSRQTGIAAQNKLLSYLGLGKDIPIEMRPGTPGISERDAYIQNFKNRGGNQPRVQATLATEETPIPGYDFANDPDYGKYAKDFSMNDFQEDPGYGFRLSEGLKSLERTAAARGGLISGGAVKAAQRFGQDMASQEYGNAYNRYQTSRSNQLNPLLSLTGAGQTSANTIGTLGQNYANTTGDLYTQSGNAKAAGIIGKENDMVSGINSVMNNYSNQQYLRMLNPGSY